MQHFKNICFVSSLQVEDMYGTLEDASITMTTPFNMNATYGNNTDMATFTQDLTQPSENESQLLTDTESLNTFAAENTSSNVYTQLLSNTTTDTESLNTFAAENTSSNTARNTVTYNKSRSTAFEDITPSYVYNFTYQNLTYKVGIICFSLSDKWLSLGFDI